MNEETLRVFRFFNEVGIIQQLSAALFNRRLPDGLHVSHFSILNHMMRLGDGETPAKLASAFQVTKPTMTHTLATLSKRGFIRLAPHESDGRSKLVFLTAAGREFHLQSITELAPAIEKLREQLDLDAINSMLPELERIRTVLDENRDI